jgi:hypothetical protein
VSVASRNASRPKNLNSAEPWVSLKWSRELLCSRRHDTQHDDTLRNGTQHYGLECDTQHSVMLRVVTQRVVMQKVVMLRVVMQRVVILRVARLNVVMLSVWAP